MPRKELDELGSLVRGTRKALRLTQAKLSEKTGIAQSELSALENGDKRDMRASNMERLAEALKLDITVLLRGFAHRRAKRRSPLDEDDVETVIDLRSHEPSPA